MRQVLYKHEGQNSLKVLDKGKSSVSLPLPKDNGYVVLEIRSWGDGGDGPAHEIIVSRDSGETLKKHAPELCVVCYNDKIYREWEKQLSELKFIDL